MAAWGDTSRDYYIRMGVKPEKIHLTGNPRVDDFFAATSRVGSEELRKAIDVPADARVILLATNPIDHMGILSSEDYAASVEAVLKAITMLGDVYLIVRPHPIEVARSPEWLQSSLLDHPRILKNPRMSLAETIVASNGVLIFNSTVALEAALAGRDVGVVNLCNADYGVDFGEHDFAVPIRSKNEILAFLSCEYPRDWDFSRRDVAAFITNVGHAAESIAESITQLGGFSQSS